MSGPEKDLFVVVLVCCLAAEAVHSVTLALESVDDVHSRHRGVEQKPFMGDSNRNNSTHSKLQEQNHPPISSHKLAWYI